ncbi:S41 family peptidase, partial [Nostoc sp. NIES-2111]
IAPRGAIHACAVASARLSEVHARPLSEPFVKAQMKNLLTRVLDGSLAFGRSRLAPSPHATDRNRSRSQACAREAIVGTRPTSWRRVTALRGGAALLCSWAVSASAADWSADFDALLAGLARNYANFEYTLTERRIDLPALAARQRVALAEATDDAQRRLAFERLLRAFGDPHLHIEWAPPIEHTESACGTHKLRPGVAFHRLPGFEPLPSAAARQFDAGLLRGQPTLGVIRIGLFIERAFLPACAEAAAQVGMAPDAPCDRACGEQLDRATVKLLNQALAVTVRELEAAGAARLVIDITDNGGGSDWSEVVSRLLAGPLRSAPVSMLRHPAWTAHLQQLKEQIGSLKLSAKAVDMARLRRAELMVERAMPKLAASCDLSAAWTDQALAMGLRAVPCNTLVKDSHFATSFEANGPAGASNPVDALLFRPAWYGDFAVGLTRRPLVILVNHDTHSSAEQFAALLRDNSRARIVGINTAGAGCGPFTDLPSAFVLPVSGARVHAPDCVRLRRDGTNERDGIVPDQIVPWARTDTPWQIARKAAKALQALPL